MRATVAYGVDSAKTGAANDTNKPNGDTGSTVHGFGIFTMISSSLKKHIRFGIGDGRFHKTLIADTQSGSMQIPRQPLTSRYVSSGCEIKA